MRPKSQTTTNFTSDESRTILRLLPAVALLSGGALLGSCGGGGGAGGGKTDPVGPPVGDDPTVTETLEALNVPLEEKTLKDRNEVEIPDDYSPIGQRFEPGKTSELVVLGEGTTLSPDRLTLIEPGSDGPLGSEPPQVLISYDSATVPWVEEEVPPDGKPFTRRAGTAADLDGDGQEEQVYAHFDDEWMRFMIVGQDEIGFVRSHVEVFQTFGEGLHVSLRAADLDGNGDQELVLGYSHQLGASLMLFDYDQLAGTIVTDPLAEKSFEPEYPENTLMLELASGNLDYDSKHELGLVVNEFYEDHSWTPPRFLGQQCAGYVLDDIETGLYTMKETAV